MKQIYLMLACCLFANLCSFAQEFPDYGFLKKEEISLKQCDFDKDANAVVLLHEASSDYDDQHQLITTHHIRLKILKEKGMSAANISIPYYREGNFEQIGMVDGMTINLTDGNQVETHVDRKSIFNRKIDERIGQVVFAFPAVKVGSIIEYKYRSIMKHYGGLKDWDFQDEFPVLISKYKLTILPNAEFAYRVNRTLDIPITINNETTGGIYFEMRNIPGLNDEPYMDARRDYMQKVIFQLSGFTGDFYSKKNYMTSWDEVTRELLSTSEFGGQLNKNIAGTDDFIKQAKLLSSPEEKMKSVFNYVRNNINWNGIYTKYAGDGVKEAWQKKSGTSGDINLLLINLLKQVGLETHPMLVSERFHGKVNSAYPFIDQFNSVFAYLTINNKKYYLDATDKNVPPHITPVDILNTTAFVVNRKEGGLINITNDTVQYKEFILAQLELAENGELTGEVTVKSSDYARIKKLQDYKKDKDKFLDRHFVVEGTSIGGKDLELNNMENDSMVLEQHCKVSGNLNTTGEYSFLPLNIFTGFDFNPFLSDNRFSNINFGYRRFINMNITIKLPAGYVVDEIPLSVKLVNPDKDIIFIRQVDHDKASNYINCLMQFEFKKSLYETEQYPVVQEMYKRLFAYLKEPVVLKRK